MTFTRYTIKDTTNGWVLCGLGGTMTRLSPADPGSGNYDPVLFNNEDLAAKCRDRRLGEPSRYQVVPVIITIGGTE